MVVDSFLLLPRSIASGPERRFPVMRPGPSAIPAVVPAAGVPPRDSPVGGSPSGGRNGRGSAPVFVIPVAPLLQKESSGTAVRHRVAGRTGLRYTRLMSRM